jgi:hypothetical protein
MEVVLTATLVSVPLGTASAAQDVGAIAALGVGGHIALAGALIAVGCAVVFRGRGAAQSPGGSGVVNPVVAARDRSWSTGSTPGTPIPRRFSRAKMGRSRADV